MSTRSRLLPSQNRRLSSSWALGWQDSAGSHGGGTAKVDHRIFKRFHGRRGPPGARVVCRAPSFPAEVRGGLPPHAEQEMPRSHRRQRAVSEKLRADLGNAASRARTQDPPETHTSIRDKATTGAGGHTEQGWIETCGSVPSTGDDHHRCAPHRSRRRGSSVPGLRSRSTLGRRLPFRSAR